MRASPISTGVDFERDGIQHGFLNLPYSRDDSAWGSVMIPITVVRNGDGPTALLTGANHGDACLKQPFIGRRCPTCTSEDAFTPGPASRPC